LLEWKFYKKVYLRLLIGKKYFLKTLVDQNILHTKENTKNLEIVRSYLLKAVAREGPFLIIKIPSVSSFLELKI